MLQNRVSKGANYSDNTNRGTTEPKTDGKIVVVRWNDNAVVTALFNYIHIEPLKTVEKYSRSEKNKIQSQMPGPIAAYNKNIEGVDLNDEFLSSYRTSITN